MLPEDDSDDDLPLFSNVQPNESVIGRDDTALQTSRYTVFTKPSRAEDGWSSPGAEAPTSLELAPLRTTGDFILMLDRLRVPGPLTMAEALDSAHHIGEGGQFTVYSNRMLDDSDCSNQIWLDKVAVKKCKFGEIANSQTLDLSAQKYRGQVYDMLLEVAALQDTRLRDHPNIVKLIGYGIETGTWHETPFLVMPLALGDLTKTFKDCRSPAILHQLLLGVGYGVDAIHECRMIHGDLKPDNVLIFETFFEPMPLIAKLADFGLSLDEVKTTSRGSVLISGYSAGWAAPEVVQAYHQRSLIPIDTLLSSDRFSYGLLVLSVLCFEAKIPPAASYRTIHKIHETISKIEPSLLKLLEISLPLVLDQVPESRPKRIKGLLEDKTEACTIWTRERDEYELWQAEQQKRVSKTYFHHWELPSLAGLLVLGLERSYRTYRELLTGPQLFAMFLLRSVHDIIKSDKALQVDILLDAARKGFPPAQGVAQRVIESYGMQAIDHLTEADMKAWLEVAVANGLPLRTLGVQNIAPQDLETSRAIFLGNSGYNQFYSPISRPATVIPKQLEASELCQWDRRLDDYNNKLIHQLATFGEIERIEALLDSDPSGINERNTLGETGLYKACLSGHWKMVLFLCQKGADASLAASERRITCLHWLFNFPASHIEQIFSAMIAAGADVNASLAGRGSLINYHFPLRWPAGTPLHWAVAVSSIEAVKALINHGADMSIRNGQDPYKADDNVRGLHSHGTAEQGEFSETPETCLGLNPIDLAVANHDWRTLEIISSSHLGDNANIFAIDEEGYSPFHRLSLNRIGTTVTGLRFWYPAFMGGETTRRNNILRTVKVLTAMGGDVNQLTGSPSTSGLSGAEGGLSPLMIAVTKSDHEVVDILCGEGANVNLQNACGRTALTLMYDLNVAGSSPPGSISAIVKSLVGHGADVNYRSPDGITPLLCASSSGDLDAVKILAKEGVDMTSTAGLLAMAHMINHTRHVKNMTHSFMSISESQQREADLAALIETYIAPAASSNLLLVGDKGKTLLHCCSYAALLECVKALVDAGSAVNAVEELGTKSHVDRYDIRGVSKARGTPLDVVLQTGKLFESKRSDRLSQAKVDYVFDKFERIRKLLINHGGKTQAQLELHSST